jgi:copper(I)-binding protein
LVSARSSAGTLVLQRRDAEGRYADVPAIDIAPDERLNLKPGASHRLLLQGLNRAVQADDRLPLTLVFERAGSIEIEIHVQAPPSAR